MRERLKVVVADDEGHIRILLKNLVSRIGGEVVGFATDGNEAVAEFLEHKPDLVLLDINMPAKGGVEALMEIREKDPEAKVIMLTSVSDRDSVVACVEGGALNYIRKDTPLGQMREAIERSLGIED